MVKQRFPDIAVKHTNVFQADHCFSRVNKLLFTDPANGTMVCSSCNRMKAFGMKSISRAIDDIVIEREGYHKWKSMFSIDRAYKTNEGWTKRAWLETNLRSLENGLQEIKRRREVCNNSYVSGSNEPVNSCNDTSDSGNCGDDCNEVFV